MRFLTPLPFQQFRRFVTARPHPGTLGPEQTVELVEKRLEVGERFLVVHVVFGASSPERRPVVGHERYLVADVALDADQDHEELEIPVCERVSAEQHRRSDREESYGDELPGMEILTHPAVRRVELVVD